MARQICILLLLWSLFVSPSVAQEPFIPCKHIPTYGDIQPSQVRHNLDLLRQECRFRVDPQVAAISGSIHSCFRTTADLDTLDFDADGALVIDSVVYHGQTLTALRTTADLIRIALPAFLSAGAYDSITVVYHGIPASNGFGSFEISTHNGQPVLWTLSEPFGARDWWPCRQTLDDKIDSLDVIITHPAPYRSASNGVIVEDTLIGNERITHWQHRYPIATYLVAIAVTNYARFDLDVALPGGTVTVINLCFPEDSAYAASGAGVVVQQMQLYDSLFGEYPFIREKYGQAQFGWGGGMEHQTMTFLGNWEAELIAHELAHHWFGDRITCGSWRDIWLNEGFATYLSGLCYEFLEPERWKPFREKLVLDGTRLEEGSVLCDDTTAVSRIFSGPLSYSKAAMVLHMLRQRIGDPAFFAGLRAYALDPSLAYGFAQTPDLQRSVEDACQCDLDPFLAEWYEGSGFPQYTAYWEHTADNSITVQLYQSSSADDGRFFRQPLELGLKGSQRDTVVRVFPQVSGERFDFETGFRVTDVVIDPNVNSFTTGNRVYRKAVDPADELLVYPNPADGQVTIRFDRPAVFYRPLRLRVFGAEGRLLRSETVTFTPALEYLLQTDDLANGLYLLELSDNQGLRRLHKLHIVHP
jgi:aminopeptidase N